jgi:hypothetical protein
VSDGMAGEPTLGEAYWRGYIVAFDGDCPYSDLDEGTRRAVEAGAAAAGAAAIARLNQPAELAAAMAETRQLRELFDSITTNPEVIERMSDSVVRNWRRRSGLGSGSTMADPDITRALDLARDEISALRSLAADILGEFKATGDGHRARIGQVGYARWAERAGLGG